MKFSRKTRHPSEIRSLYLFNSSSSSERRGFLDSQQYLQTAYRQTSKKANKHAGVSRERERLLLFLFFHQGTYVTLVF